MSPSMRQLFNQSSTNSTIKGGTVYDYISAAIYDLRCSMSVTSETNPIIVIDLFMNEIKSIK